METIHITRSRNSGGSVAEAAGWPQTMILRVAGND